MEIIKFAYEHISNRLKMNIYIFIYFIYILCLIAFPFFGGKLIDIMVYSRERKRLIYYCAIILIISICKVLLSFIIQILYSDLLTTSAYKVSCFVIDHINNCPVSRTDNMDPAYYNQRISQDAGNIISFYISTIVGGLNAVLEVIISLTVITYFSKKIALTIVLLLGLYIFTYCLLRRKLYIKGKYNMEAQAVYFSKIYEQLRNTRFVKIHSLKDFFHKRLEVAFKRFKTSYMNYQKISTCFNCINSFILSLAQVVLYLLGGIYVMLKKMTIGHFTIINSYFGKLTDAASFFFSYGSSYQNTLVSYNRILDILSWHVEEGGEIKIRDIQSISLIDVSFGYDNNEVLHNVNISFEKGNIYVLKGQNGCGKSTLIQLILGLYQKEMSGDILVNKIPMNLIDMNYLRKNNISYSEQEPILFTDSIMKNITLTENDDLIENIDIINLHLLDFVNKTEEGFNTLIKPRTDNLSGGEKQRIEIARMIIKDCSVIILDEPTSALDKVIVDKLINYLRKIKENKIILLITHDLRLIDIADSIVDFSRMN